MVTFLLNPLKRCAFLIFSHLMRSASLPSQVVCLLSLGILKVCPLPLVIRGRFAFQEVKREGSLRFQIFTEILCVCVCICFPTQWFLATQTFSVDLFLDWVAYEDPPHAGPLFSSLACGPGMTRAQASTYLHLTSTGPSLHKGLPSPPYCWHPETTLSFLQPPFWL